MKKYLITGCAGFIGSNFVHYMLKKYPEILLVNLDKLTYAGNPQNIAGLPQSQVELVQGDICDAALLERIVPGHDSIVHFAAESHNDNSIANPEPFITTNVEGTFHLLEAARKHDVRFHHISTDEVYGDLALDDPCKFTESTPYKPSSPYSASKAASDQLVRAWVRTYGLRATISNCSNNYGPKQHPEKLIPKIVSNALAGKEIPIYGDGKNVRDWLYVLDHCKAIDLIFHRGRSGETYNVGGHNERPNIFIVKTIIEQLHDRLKDDGISEELIKHVADRLGHDRRYGIDPTKIKNDLGWYPETPFEKGIVLTIDWYLDHEEWMEHITSGNYQKYYEEMYKNK